jgi:hypothetical protein
MRAMISWTSHNGEHGPDVLEREFNLEVLPRAGEELCLHFHPVPPHLAPDGSAGPDGRGFEGMAGTTVDCVRWTLLETGDLVPVICIEDTMGLEEDDLAGLLALGWKKG